MKMVSAAKFARAERELKHARPYGQGAQAFYEKVDAAPKDDAEPVNYMSVAITSDRGLCGACHSSICKSIKADFAAIPKNYETRLVIVGDKAKAILQKPFANKILMSFNEIGRLPPKFADASKIACDLLKGDFKFDIGNITYNTFRTVVSYTTTKLPIYSEAHLKKAEKIALYDSVDDDIMQSYQEFGMTSLIYFALKESAASEQSSRMTAMENSTKNAGEMIQSLQLQFNRTRQNVITRELIEIISGAAALK